LATYERRDEVVYERPARVTHHALLFGQAALAHVHHRLLLLSGYAGLRSPRVLIEFYPQFPRRRSERHVKKMLFATPQDAEAAFYEAFMKHDLEAMMAVWSDDDEVYCVHPHGPRITGVAQVRESWRQIFTAAQSVRFQVREQHLLQAMMVSIHSVYEHITMSGESRARGCVLATNIYMRTERGWRMMVHHASPAPELAEAEPRRVKTLH
jgi:ketosteroid isomerase-like protein